IGPKVQAWRVGVVHVPSLRDSEIRLAFPSTDVLGKRVPSRESLQGRYRKNYSSPRTCHQSACSNCTSFSLPCWSYQLCHAAASFATFASVISCSARKLQLRVCGVVFGSWVSDIKLGTIRIRCARLKLPQSETLHPARLRTCSEGSFTKESNSWSSASSVPK